MKFLITAAALTFTLQVSAADQPRLSNERVIFHTNAGDIVAALYPDLAPGHVKQILKLAAAGIYDGIPIGRIDRGFVAQVYNYDTRSVPVSPEQRAVVQKIPAEFNSILHKRGILSMARYDEDVNSAEASFSFLLGDAPHLDGKYTVIGEVVSGMEVLAALEKIPVDRQFAPIVPVLVERAEVIEAKDLNASTLRAAHVPALPGDRGKVLFEVVAAMMFCFTIAPPIYKSIKR